MPWVLSMKDKGDFWDFLGLFFTALSAAAVVEYVLLVFIFFKVLG